MTLASNLYMKNMYNKSEKIKDELMNSNYG